MYMSRLEQRLQNQRSKEITGQYIGCVLLILVSLEVIKRVLFTAYEVV